jgi:hypothetical protein
MNPRATDVANAGGVCRLWRGLAEDNGWSAPVFDGGLDGGVVAEAKQRVEVKLHGLVVDVTSDHY